MDKIFFRPISHVWKFETSGPAKNANALGHVPNSSWYTNRLSRHSVSPDRVAQGACETREMPPVEEWKITGGKVGGNNPGFQVEAKLKNGETRRYLLKFDGDLQTERATAADAIGSSIYWAAGFEAPCNRIVHIDFDKVEIGEEATKEDRVGRESPMKRKDVQKAIRHAPRDDTGEVRALASRFLPGEPLGPFSYVGVRKDDKNDAIPHEDRRELRGSKLIAAWINHFDARQQNTYTSFIRKGDSEKGYVQHFMLDFGDCFGSVWPSDAMTRRFGHSWYVDFPDMGADLVSLGLIDRPWHRVEKIDGLEVFGYYDVEEFDPTKWKAGYPNLAFRRMDLRDAFWATNIISKFSDAHVRELVAEAEFTEPRYTRFLTRVMIGRRDKIVEEYFERLSPLVDPEPAADELCLEDAWVSRGYGPRDGAFYQVRHGPAGEVDGRWTDVGSIADERGRLCTEIPSANRWRSRRRDLVVEMRVRRHDQREPARSARFFLRPISGGDSYRVVGILRVGDHP